MEAIMSEIRAITNRIRHQQWADEINDRIQSGLSVSDWCYQHGIGVEAYKYRLRVVRREAMQAAPAEFVELLEPAKHIRSQGGTDYAVPQLPQNGISIEINGAIIRFDCGTPESAISSAVRAVRDA